MNSIDFQIKLEFKPKFSSLSVYGLYADNGADQFDFKKLGPNKNQPPEKFGFLVARDEKED